MAPLAPPDNKRRRLVSALLLGAAAMATAACAGNSPGSSSSDARQKADSVDSAALDRLVAAEKPAPASSMPAGSTARKIRDRGDLIVGASQTAPLFSTFNPGTGRLEGFDAALSELLAKYVVGKPATSPVPVNSQIREELLKDHSVDVVFATYTITPQRLKEVGFAGPYFMDGLAVEVRKGSGPITSLKDLAGKNVVTQLGSTVPAVLKSAAPTAQIRLFETNSECLGSLKSHDADAYVLDQSVLAGNALSDPDVKVLPGTYTKEPYGIGLPKDADDFKVFVNTWLRRIEADGTWAKVWQATIGSEVAGPAPVPPAVS